MKKLFASVFSLCLFSFQLFSQEIKFSGEAASLWASALRSENQGDFLLGDTYLNGKFEAFYEKSSAYAEGNFGFDEVSETKYYGLKEIWLDHTSDFWGIRIGRQKVAWGKADGIDITNVICPKDYSSTRALFDDEHLAVDSARLSLSKDSFSLDAYFIPFFTESPLPKDKTEQLSSINKPEKNLKSSEYGLKLSGYFSWLDFSLYGFYGWEDTPFLDYLPKIENEIQTGFEINAEYKKMTMLGCDTAIPVDELVFRAESAFFPKRHFQTKAEKILSGEEISKRHDNLLALAGLDWMPATWTFTAQYFCDYVFLNKDEKEYSENLEREETYTHGATLSISKSLFSETLKLSASGVLMLNDLDSVIELSGEYSLSDSIFIEVGGYIFNEGKEVGTYGQYKNLTCAYLKARYLF